MKLTLVLLLTAYLAADLCLWHGPLDQWLNARLDGERQVVARVQGQAITAGDLNSAISHVLFRRGQDWATLEPAAQTSARQEVLALLTDGARVRAARLAATPPLPAARGVDEELRLFIKQFPLETDYPARLPLQQITEGQLRARMQAANDDQAWIEVQIAPQVAAVTEAEARAWFATHAAELTVPERFHAAHVFLSGHELDKPDRSAEIAALRERLASGSISLAALAATASDDERSKLVGGDLGWFSRDHMPADFMAAVTPLAPGQLSAPVRTSLGWHVIQVIEKRPARLPAFDEVKEEILATLRNERRTAAVGALLERLRAGVNGK